MTCAASWNADQLRISPAKVHRIARDRDRTDFQNRSLRNRIGRTLTGRVVRIAFDFRGRPSWLSTSTPIASAPKGNGGGEKQWLAKNHAIRLFHIRNDVGLFVGLAARKPANARDAAINLRKSRRSTVFIPF